MDPEDIAAVTGTLHRHAILREGMWGIPRGEYLPGHSNRTNSGERAKLLHDAYTSSIVEFNKNGNK
jgi:hypothetical protein